MFIIQSFNFIIFIAFTILIIMIRLYNFIIYTINVSSILIYIMHFRSLFNVTAVTFI